MKRKFLFLLFLWMLCFSGCQKPSGMADSSSRVLESMDTVMQLTSYGENRDIALDAAVNEINRLNELLSTENASSEIAQLNRHGSAVLSQDSRYLLSCSLHYYEITDGYFDITVYPLSKLWGFPSRNYQVPSEEDIGSVLKLIGSDRIVFNTESGNATLEDGQQIDFGGIAKGYTSQRVTEIFKANGISSAIISLGGNVQCLGTKPDGSPWKIGIQDPRIGSSDIIAAVSVEDKAVITSGGYERYFKDPDTGKIYKHILNPKTGYPVDNDLASVTVIAEDGTLGDALSTALFSMGLEKATVFWRENSFDFQALFVDNQNRIYITEGLQGSVSSDRPITVIPLK